MPFLLPLLWSVVTAAFTLLMGGLGRIITLTLSLGLGSILATLGTGYIVFEGFGILLDEMHLVVVGYFALIPAQILQMLGMLKVDIAINIIFSAYVTRFLINNVYSSFKKINFLGGAS
jgi:hypothetical protein